VGNALRVIPGLDLPQNYRAPISSDSDLDLLDAASAIQPAVSHTALPIGAAEIQSLLRSAPIFRNLTGTECREIVSLALERRYPNRQLIVHEGDERREVLLLVSGRVKISQISQTGDEVIFRIRRGGDIIAGLGMSPGESHCSTIRAMEPCHLLSWKAEDFERLCSRSTALQRNVIQIMKGALQVLQECFCELATLKVSARLARTLLRLAEQENRGNENVHIPLTCEELGQMAGTTLFTVSRLLNKWAEQGLLHPEKRGIVIEDLVGLLAIADECLVSVNELPVA
jgi:CRP/FNR family transcriptional regulator, nitrogen oxide reductase regulator